MFSTESLGSDTWRGWTCSGIGGDQRLQEMARLVRSKSNEEGKCAPESEWKAWKGWDFGQKKEPSRWLTFLVLRALRRLG